MTPRPRTTRETTREPVVLDTIRSRFAGGASMKVAGCGGDCDACRDLHLVAACACGWRSPGLLCRPCERDLVEPGLPRACWACGGPVSSEVRP